MQKLGLSFHNAATLNAKIDALPTRAKWYTTKLKIDPASEEEFELWHRDPEECIRALYGNPTFAEHLLFAPIREFADDGCTCHLHDDDMPGMQPPEGPFCDGSCGEDRAYSEMNTADWWWKTQVSRTTTPTHAPNSPCFL